MLLCLDTIVLLYNNTEMTDQISNSTNINDQVEQVEKVEKVIKIKPIFEVEEDTIDPKDYKLINIDNIDKIPTEYPAEFKQFCELNDLKPPNITSNCGKALASMLVHPCNYWNRETCDVFVKKFGIDSGDSIQMFNKHSISVWIV